MPYYDFLCKKCGNVKLDVKLSICDNELKCDICHNKMEHIIGTPSFVLNGNGWAKDGYSSKPKVDHD